MHGNEVYEHCAHKKYLPSRAKRVLKLDSQLFQYLMEHHKN